MAEVITKIIWYLIWLMFLVFISYLLWDISYKLQDHNKITTDIYNLLKYE